MLAEIHGISEHVRFFGRLRFDELRDFYRSLSLFLIPSEQEGLAIVGVEAMACGVPVISTKCGGPETYVQHGINGYLCEFNATEIAKFTVELLGNEELYLNFSKTARSNVLEEYAQNTFEGKLSKHWFSLWGEEM